MRDPFSLCGSTIDGRFRVDEVIGEGGFGVVYRGVHLKLDHPVAIKCLKIPEHFTDDAKKVFLERFREEARILLKLGDAPGVPRLFDYEVHRSRHEQDVPLLVMEWLEGKTLEDALEARKKAGLGRLPPSDAVSILLPAIEALAFAHRNRIAHRDIKPANLFLAGGSRGLALKVLDFGIAKGMQEGETLAQAQTKTATSFRAFTPNYAAPEQFRPRQFGASGPWSDVHALGLILVELLSGAQANAGEDLIDCLENVMSKDRPSPRARGVEISDELESVVRKAVALASAERYPDAGELAQALASVPEARERTSEASLKVLFGDEPKPKPYPTPAVDVAPTGPVAGATVLSGGPLGSAASSGSTKEPVTRTTSDADDRGREASRSVGDAQKSSPRAILLGAAVILAGGAALYAIVPGDAPPASSSTTSSSSSAAQTAGASSSAKAASAPSGKKEVLFARSVRAGRELAVVLPIADGDAKNQHHVRVTREDGRITNIEHVTAAGKFRLTEVITYAADGGWQSVAKNSRGQVAETVTRTKDGIETHVSRAGSPFVEGCARWAFEFSDKSNTVDRTCQDAEGYVIIDAAGCQVVKIELNDKNLVTSRRCFQSGGTALADADGIHLKRLKYDERGNRIEEAYFDADDRSFSSGGCASRRSEYDAAGNWVLHTCIGANNLPAPSGGTKAVSQRYEYDQNGCQIRADHVDAEGKLTAVGGVASVLTKRDEHCTELANASRNAAGELARGEVGYARRDGTLDAEGNMIEAHCFDAQDKPASCVGYGSPNDGHIGRYKYDDRGREISKRHFDIKGNPAVITGNYPHEMRAAWNDKGLLVEKSYWDADGKPAPALVNVGKRVFRYDALGGMTSFACFGIDGAPIIAGTGIHELRQTYDDKHRFIAIELRDLDGRPAANPTIHFGRVPWPPRAVRLEVSREGSRVVENRFLDKSGKLVTKVDCSDASTPCLRRPSGAE